MTTETELRSALRARAADATTFDVEQLLDELRRHPGPVRSAVVRAHGRQWAIAGVAAGVVALAAVPVTLVAIDSGGDRPGTGAGGPVVTASSAVTDAATGPSTVAPSASADVTGSPTAVETTPTSSVPTTGTSRPPNPNDPAAPFPLDASWVDAQADPTAVVDPAAIVFSSDPIVAFYLRPHEQLSILPGGGTEKDSSDAPWHTAVQVELAGSGFDPAAIGNPVGVTVNGVARQFGTLPKLLDVPGPAAVPSLVWQVGDAWVVLQIDTPAVPTAGQLAAAAARLDVHPG